MTRPVIVTGDDFGYSSRVNHAIIETHKKGVLSAASLMMTGEAVDEAVSLAKDNPSLAVGLHLAVTRSKTVLHPEKIPAITGPNGRLGDDLAACGVRYFFSPAARRDLAKEIRAQFDAFRATGLTLDHVDVHNHMHMHPTVLGMIMRIGRDFGAASIRLPYEPYAAARHMFSRGSFRLLLSWLGLWPWSALMKLRLKGAGFFCNDNLFGMSHTGLIDRDALSTIFANLPARGLNEVHLHPGLSEGDDDVETAALTADAVGEALRTNGLQLTTYGVLQGIK